MVTVAGIASLSLLTAAPLVSCSKSARLSSFPNSNGVRLKFSAAVPRATRLATRRLTIRANVFDDVKKATSGGQSEAEKAMAGVEKEVKKDFTQAKNEVGKVERNLEGAVADVKSGVEAESAETKEKVADAVEELKERVNDAIESEKK